MSEFDKLMKEHSEFGRKMLTAKTVEESLVWEKLMDSKFTEAVLWQHNNGFDLTTLDREVLFGALK